MNTKTKATRELALGIGVLVLATLGVLFIIPYGIVMPENIEVRALAPNFWPLIVVVAAGIAGAIVTVQGFADRKRPTLSPTPDESAPADHEIDDDRPLAQASIRVVIVVASIFVLYFAIPHAGIVAGSMALLAFLIWFAEERRLWMILAISILLPLVLYAFFVYVANVPMPLGVFESLR